MLSIEEKLRKVIEEEVNNRPHYRISASDLATDLIPALMEKFNIRNKGWVNGPNGVV